MAFQFNFDNLKNEKIISEDYLTFLQKKTTKLELALSNPDTRIDYRKDTGNSYIESGYIENGYFE